MWKIENINLYHCLFVRIHKSNIKPGDKSPSVSSFANTPRTDDNLSSDWCKYATPESSRQLIGKQKNKQGNYKNPFDFYIWRFNIQALMKMYVPQRIVHDPLYNEPELDGEPNNQAHSKIVGEKRENEAEFKLQIKRAGSWVIAP